MHLIQFQQILYNHNETIHYKFHILKKYEKIKNKDPSFYLLQYNTTSNNSIFYCLAPVCIEDLKKNKSLFF